MAGLQLASHHAQQGLGVAGIHQAGREKAGREPGASSGTRLASEPGQELEGRGRGRGLLHGLLQGAGGEEEGREAQGNAMR